VGSESAPVGCLFCGATPRTKTHALRKGWLETLFPFGEPFESSIFTAHPIAGDKEHEWRSEQFSLSPRIACTTCNSTWMDQVDRAAERVIDQMVRGNTVRIKRIQDFRATARWASQLALLLDQAQPEAIIPEELARDFYETREPLPGSFVWLARAEPELNVRGWMRSWLLDWIPNETPIKPNGCLVTFRIVNLVLQTFIPLSDGIRDRFVPVATGESLRATRQVWPTKYQPLSWPPDIYLPATTLDTFAARFESENVGRYRPNDTS
jgi:hypothetical protein